MSRRYAGSHTLPENPEWIEFPRSDGDPSLLPKNTTRLVDSDGQVNFMRPVSLDESLAILWRVGVGAQLAVRMGLPEGPNYVLKAWPEGYQLFDHNKGPAKAPRHDAYLCGSANVNRFRSINEFIPHALWLIQDPTMDRGNCSCKYCTKQPQRIISDTLGLSQHSGRRSASVAGAVPHSAKVGRPRREAREPRQGRVPPKPYAAVRRAPKPPKVLPGPSDFILPERDLDIRAALISGEDQHPRWFRKGELLWCHLEPPIRGRTPDEDIQFWPALVEDFRVKPQPVFRANEDAQQDRDAQTEDPYREAVSGSPDPGESDEVPVAGPSKSASPAVEAQGAVPWTVKQWYVYRMKLLGTTQHCFVTDEQVLPYLAYAPSDLLLDRVREELSEYLQTVPIDQMDRDVDRMSDFDPLEPEPQGDEPDAYYAKYKRAAAPYTLAIQVAANVAQYWLPTDEWECKFTIPPPGSSPTRASPHPEPSASQAPPPPSQPQPLPPAEPSEPASLHSLITQSLSQNAIPPPPSSRHPESISTQARIPRTSTVAQTVSQTRFQGIWWGTERIWTDELVRLKIARCQFAPKGTEMIYPPAGPSPSTLESMKDNPEAAAADPQRLGASEKGLFLRLEGLFVVDVPNAEGTGLTRECRASGMVYELADDDWDDAADSSSHTAATGGSSKGKEREVSIPNGHAHAGSGEHPPQDPDGVPTFMTQPSPMKPPPLPNPDPSVPVQETAATILSQTSPEAAAQQKKEKAHTLNDQLSHPLLSTPYPLPPATKGFKFRPILPPDHEAVISLSLISGRYYPGLFHHPLMAPTVAHALTLSADDGGLYHHRHLWAMEGLLPGIHQSMDPRHWRRSRLVMLQEADREARDRLRERWEEIKMARLHPSDTEGRWEEGNGADAMEVD
ncbi:hypothetical protein C8Q77DRAFT_1133756 [Trametes polyzona]|nr:hypothetical protein C8Q77DRAFT_1133756 [Trametes polyzona]